MTARVRATQNYEAQSNTERLLTQLSHNSQFSVYSLINRHLACKQGATVCPFHSNRNKRTFWEVSSYRVLLCDLKDRPKGHYKNNMSLASDEMKHEGALQLLKQVIKASMSWMNRL